MRLWPTPLLLCVALCLGCSEGKVPGADAPAGDLSAGVDLPLGETAVDQGDLDLRAELGLDLPGDMALDAAGDATPLDLGPDGPTADGPSPLGPYLVARAAIHMHSAYSHDGCDGKGIVNGVVNTKCNQQLRAAICKTGLDFVALTDHPSNMKSYTMAEDLLYDAAAGDTLVMHKGAPIANRIKCNGGKTSVLSVGYESKHMMPLGLHALPATKALYDGVSDSTGAAKIKQQVTALQALGAVVAMVHSEEKDISAKSIVDGGFEVMEWYNIHANFAALLGEDAKLSLDIKNLPVMVTALGKLVGMVPFLEKKTGGPHADLAYLLFLDVVPKQGFTKWRQAQATRRVTGVLGSDIHQNVSLDQNLCAGLLAVVCNGALLLAEASLGIKLPAVIKNLVLTGGTITLSDGGRIDSYGRLLRWMENRVLVKKLDQLEFQNALREGRAYGLFSVFGEPEGFHFVGKQQGLLHQMGAAVKGTVALEVSAPNRPVALGGAPFSKAEALKAEVETRLYHTDSSGTTLVKKGLTLGGTLTHSASKPGAYHVEVWLKPKHLINALGTSNGLASKQYLWIISNAIFVSK